MKGIFLSIAFSLMLSVALCQGGVEESTPATYPNRVKLNLTGLPLNNYAVQFERVLSRKSAVALSLRVMPEGKIPFQSKIKELVAEEDPSIQKTVDQLLISNWAITPEYRFYFGKGSAKGFYIAPFYRYAHFEGKNVLITYTTDLVSNEENVNLSGKLDSHTGGLLFGAHWNLSNRISLDWMILGPHFGTGDGLFSGISSRTLSPGEQQRVRDELEALDIPFTRKKVEVNAQGASLQLEGPWGGIRSGLSLGFHF